jgi:hypothetical protein
MFLLNKLWGYLAAAGGVILIILGALGLAKRAGVKQEQAKETEKALNDAKEASKIDSAVHDKSDATVADELRKYTRD